jgi:glycine hydroxymethyltransferase
MKEPEMEQIAALIDDVITHINDDHVINRVREEVMALCARFPVPGLEPSA